MKGDTVRAPRPGHTYHEPFLCVASDLDGTIVRSRADEPGLVVVETLGGRAIGFLSISTWRLLARLQRTVHFVPATTRTAEQYRRLRFPERPPCAVVESGARILVGDEPHEEWDSRVRSVMSSADASSRDVGRKLSGLDAVTRVRYGDVALVRAEVSALTKEVETFATWCADHGWVATFHRRRLYVLPAGIDKVHAVRFVVDELGGHLAATAGDGPLDVALIEAGESGFVPADAALRRSHPEVGTPVTGTGTASANQIVLSLIRAAENHRRHLHRPDRSSHDRNQS